MTYPNTYYASTAQTDQKRDSLTGDIDIDVCIVGAGIAGLSCALALLNQGKRVVIVDREAVAWGASGRNGGLVMPGWALSIESIEKQLGIKHAKSLFDMSVKGVAIIRENINQYSLANCDVKVGQLQVARHPQSQKLKQHRQRMIDKYQCPLTFLETAEVREICRTSRYFEGLYCDQAFHFHPLNYCLGLAQVIEKKGGVIYENTSVIKVSDNAGRQQVSTDAGAIICDQVVFCGGGYTGKEVPTLHNSILPIATYMVLTEPLGSLAGELITKAYSIMDDRRAADYYRLVEGDRLLWGSRITTKNQTDEQRLALLLREDLCSVYPQLAKAKIDKAWSGLMAYASHKMPIVKQHKPGQWICSSFGGHGLNTGTICGTLVAQSICGINDDYQLLAPFGCHWNGGVLGPIVANMTYKYLRFKDKFQESGV
jgi:gamma-glutamylputrescine oxidase